MSSTAAVSYGAHVVGDAELRLCGDVQGRRVVELGVADPPNAVALAQAGAKAIVVDPSAEVIADIRRRAEAAEVRIECHQADLADLGTITSASVDVVLLVHRLSDVEDVARLLRQAHRILKPDALFVLATEHPAAALAAAGEPGRPRRRYGESTRTLSELFMALQRANFGVDVLLELDPVDQRDAVAPAVLVVRARKLGV